MHDESKYADDLERALKESNETHAQEQERIFTAAVNRDYDLKPKEELAELLEVRHGGSSGRLNSPANAVKGSLGSTGDPSPKIPDLELSGQIDTNPQDHQGPDVAESKDMSKLEILEADYNQEIAAIQN